MLAPKSLKESIVDNDIKRSEKESIKPVLVDGNLIACFSDGSLVPGFISASMQTDTHGFTIMTVTFETQVDYG